MVKQTNWMSKSNWIPFIPHIKTLFIILFAVTNYTYFFLHINLIRFVSFRYVIFIINLYHNGICMGQEWVFFWLFLSLFLSVYGEPNRKRNIARKMKWNEWEKRSNVKYVFHTILIGIVQLTECSLEHVWSIDRLLVIGVVVIDQWPLFFNCTTASFHHLSDC